MPKQRTQQGVGSPFGGSTPSQSEQIEVQLHVLKMSQVRPQIKFLEWVATLASVFILTLFIAFVLRLLLGNFNLINTPSLMLLISVGFFFSCILNLKKIIILIIKCYQTYAPIKLRRRCRLKPTCSEYALIVIERDGVLKGSSKTIKRLLFVCRGPFHRIHEP